MRHTPFSREAKKVALTARERRDLRERLVSYMEYHPFALPLPRRRASSTSTATSVVSFIFREARLRPLAGVVAAFLVIAVPVSAERALPGDALYPVKVRFNESVRSSLTRSPYEKIEWEAARVERRIAEARLLAEEGRLTDETRDELAATVREHTSAANAQLTELRESDASGATIAAVALESALDVQTAVLDSDGVAEPDRTGADTTVISTALREARSEVASSSKTEVGNASSYERLMARVEEDTTRISALRTGLSDALDEGNRAELDERSARLEETVEVAREQREVGDDAAATATLRDALSTTQKLIAFLSNIDVRKAVSLDVLVPDDFGEGQVVRHLAVVGARRDVLDVRLEEAPTALADAAADELAAFDAALSGVSELMAEGAYLEATTRIAEAEQYLAAVETLLTEADTEGGSAPEGSGGTASSTNPATGTGTSTAETGE